MVQRDLLGTVRPQGTGFDLGAFEFLGEGTGVSYGKQYKVHPGYQLLVNYPNPFNDATVISYHLSEQAKVNLVLFNMLGQRIKVLVDAIQSPGNKQIILNAAELMSGIYFCQLKVEGQQNFSAARKLILVE